MDDCSRFTKIYFLNRKDEVEEIFLVYETVVENQLGQSIERLRSDKDGEYETYFLKKLYETNDIIHETPSPYTPEHNGIA